MNYYIGDDNIWMPEDEYLAHWNKGSHKYLMKIGEGAKARYLYTQAEVAAYMGRGRRAAQAAANKAKNVTGRASNLAKTAAKKLVQSKTAISATRNKQKNSLKSKKPVLKATITDSKGNKREYTGKDAAKLGAAVAAAYGAKKVSIAYHKAKYNTQVAAYKAVDKVAKGVEKVGDAAYDVEQTAGRAKKAIQYNKKAKDAKKKQASIAKETGELLKRNGGNRNDPAYLALVEKQKDAAHDANVYAKKAKHYKKNIL